MTTPLPPCNDDREHDYEIVLRCTRCGFLIRCEHTPHDINLAKQIFRGAITRIRSWIS